MIHVVDTVNDMQNICNKFIQSGETIGFVPTMGYLHEGHLSLIKKAREENSKVIISIFVNPLQFGPNEDYDTYPRDFDRDKKLANEAGADYIFHPTVNEMYPDDMTVQLTVKKRTNVLCGRNRKGHFDGVATILLKLFSIIRPNRAYFGLKDAQQVAIVDGLIRDFNLPITLCPVETVREHDGLAKSSRNVNLTTDERLEAPYLYKSLLEGEKLIQAGERNPNVVITTVKKYLQSHIKGFIEYVEIYSFPSLQPLIRLEGKIIIALAVKYSKARLIDNIIIKI